MSDHERFDDEHESAEDRRLSALLRATQARPNPAVWQRVRAELSAAALPQRARGFDAVLAWFTRPAALAAATAVLVVSLGAGYGWLESLTRSGAGDAMAYESGTLMETLLDDATAVTEPADDAGEEPGAGSGDGAEADSGGRS